MVPVLCNPSTGQFFHLPKVKTRRIGVSCYFGYDPVKKQYKVLSMTYLIHGRSNVFEEHQVLTLGTGKPWWRMIECRVPHYSSRNRGICMDGVLYYKAAAEDSWDSMIVCFELRSEKFSFVRAEQYGTLIYYNDIAKQEWSEHTYVLPSSWKNVVGDGFLCFVGVRKNEIVLSTYYQSVPFYVYYYNAERNTVEIQGMYVCGVNDVYTFVDYVQDVKLMPVL